MYEDELMAFEQDAERSFSDFDSGLDGDLYEDGYDDDYDDFDDVDDVYEDHYSSYAENIGEIDPNDRTYTISVTNAGAAAEQAILFGAYQNPASGPNITIAVAESSVNELNEESKSNPFKIAGMKMSVTNNLQFDNVLELVQRTSGGKETKNVVQPRNFTSPQNFNQLLIDSGEKGFTMDVTGQHSLRFLVNPSVTVVFTFTVKARTNMANLLKGQNVAEISRDPRTTGLPQVDILQERKAKLASRRRTAAKVKRALPVPVSSRGGRLKRRRR